MEDRESSRSIFMDCAANMYRLNQPAKGLFIVDIVCLSKSKFVAQKLHVNTIIFVCFITL